MKYLLILCLFVAPAINAQQKKNVLFIVVDDLRPLLGCYGDTNAYTPNIDRLAASGMVFDRAYCQQAVCAPSRASFMTGKRPDELKIWTLSQPFRSQHPGIVTLPQHFMHNGYTTAAAGKIYHDPAAHQDPASWTLPAMFGVTGNGKYILEENKGKSKAAAVERVEVDDTAYVDGQVADAAIDLLAQCKNQPFFLAVGFRRPHLPFTAPAKYWKLYDGKQLPLPDTTAPEGAPAIAFHQSQELRGYTSIPEPRELIQGYYAAVSYIDAQVGKLLDALDRFNLTNNTIIVFFSDHGYHLGEQGMWCKSTNFEVATRVPLIISAPGIIKHAGHTSAITELVDLYPTISALCGIGRPDSLAGNSLLPVLQNPKARVKDYAVSQFIRPYGAISNVSKITTMGYSLRTDKYRFTEWYDFKTGELVATELYDEVGRVNLAGRKGYRKQVKSLRKLLRKNIFN